MNFFKKSIKGHKTSYYALGVKMYTHSANRDYDKAYKRRFKGLTLQDAQVILKWQFKNRTGYELNIASPKSFNEKLQWLKLYYHTPLITQCSDKYRVRQYVEKKVGKDVLVPLIGAWNSPEEIDFDKLPKQFAMKVNWGSGQNIICSDKSKLNVAEARGLLKKWMNPKSNHYYDFLEWGYKDIKPMILAEQYLTASQGTVNDYKFFCFNGVPLYMYVATDSWNHDLMRINYYDMDFKQLDLVRNYPNTSLPLEKPSMWDKMQEMSSILSKPFPFARVDFMQVDDVLYFGEITFYPGNGTDPFTPEKWDYVFGEKLELPFDTNFTTYA